MAKREITPESLIGELYVVRADVLMYATRSKDSVERRVLEDVMTTLQDVTISLQSLQTRQEVKELDYYLEKKLGDS